VVLNRTFDEDGAMARVGNEFDLLQEDKDVVVG
jgi:hypothetical protein